jgi:hypothetical protein
MKRLLTILLLLLSISALGAFTQFGLLPPPDGLLTTKGSIIGHDGSEQQEFLACADGEILEWDAVETQGFKCVTIPVGIAEPSAASGDMLYYDGTDWLTADALKYNDTLNTLSIGQSDGDTQHTVSGATITSSFEIHSEGLADLGGFAIHRHNNNFSFGAHQLMLRSRGTHDTPLVVQDEDILARIISAGYNGTGNDMSSEIRMTVDGAVGVGDMPGRIEFLTSADGSNAPAERMRIAADGDITMSGTGAVKIHSGTTAQQPSAPAAGMLRFNSDDTQFEGYDGTAWGAIAGGSTSPTTTKGDITVHDGTSDVRLPIGADGEVLYADSTTTEGAAWKNPISGISQSHVVGRATQVGAANCNYQTSISTSLIEMVTDADCDVWVANGITATNDALEITIPDARTDGYYRIDFSGIMRTALGADSNGTFRLYNQTDSQVLNGGAYTSNDFESPQDASSFANHISSIVKFSSTGDKVIDLRAISGGSNDAFVFNDVANDRRFLSFVVYFEPDENSPVATQEVGLTDVYAHSNGNTELTANVTNIDFSTEVRDKFNEWNGSEFTSRKKQKVKFEGHIILDTAVTFAVELYVDTGSGYSVAQRCSDVQSSTSAGLFDCSYELEAEWKAAVRITQSEGLNNSTFPQQRHYINISEVITESTLLGKFEGINDTELCQVEAVSNTATTITANTEDIPFTIVNKDNCAGWSNAGNTGGDLNDAFTAPRSARYDVKFSIIDNNASGDLNINAYVDGALSKVVHDTASGGSSRYMGGFSIDLLKDEVLTFRTSDTITLITSSVSHWITITESPDLSAVVDNLGNSKRLREDQYSESEIEWGKWNGEQLYRRCFTVGSDITTTSTITTWASGLNPKNLGGHVPNSWQFFRATEAGSGADFVVVTYNDTTGEVGAILSGTTYQVSSGTSFCMEYTK